MNRHNKHQKKFTANLKTGKCKFPFVYREKKHSECIDSKGERDGLWCATSVDKERKMKTWAYCKTKPKVVKPTTQKRVPPSRPAPKRTVRMIPAPPNFSPPKRKSTSVVLRRPSPPKIAPPRRLSKKISDLALYKEIRIEKNTFGLVIGNVQSGKTEVMQGYCAKSKEMGKKVLYLLRNMKADLDQLIKRFDEFNKKYKTEIKVKIINKYKLTDFDTMTEESFGEFDVILSLMNPISLNKFKVLASKFNFEFNICVDESDLITGDDLSSEKELNEITKLPNLFNYLEVTATPMANIFTNKMNYFYKLEKSSDYVDIRHPRILWQSCESVESKEVEKDVAVMGNILERGLLKKICIALMITSNKNKEQEYLLSRLINKYNKYLGITFNQKGVSLKQFNPETGQAKTIKKYDTISDAISGAIQMGNKYICIMAGRKADRGIGFVSNDYKYHLTDLYLRSISDLSKSSMYCESLVQKLRILGIYRSEHEIYKGELERRLCIWCSPGLKDEILNCNNQIDLITEKLVEITRSGTKIRDPKFLNKELEKLRFRTADLPGVPTTKKRFEGLKIVRDCEDIIDEIGEKRDLKVKYDKDAAGWHFKVNPMRYCNLTNNECSNVAKEILGDIKAVSKRVPDVKNMFLYDLYFEDMIQPELRETIFELRGTYLKDKTNKQSKLVFNKLLKQNCQRFVERNIIGKVPLEKYPQLEKYIKKYGDKVQSYDYKNYCYFDLGTVRAAFRNRRIQIEKELEGVELKRKIYASKPFVFSFGNSKFREGVIDTCPVHFTVKIPFDFEFENELYKCNIEENDLLYWHNLVGDVFINFADSEQKLLRTYINEGEKIIQVKEGRLRRSSSVSTSSSSVSTSSSGSSAPRVSSSPKARSRSSSSYEDSPIPNEEDYEKLELKRIHKFLYQVSSDYLQKSPQKELLLKQYHELREKYWLKDFDPINYLIDKLESLYKKDSKRVSEFKFADLGCGHAKIKQHFKDRLNVKSYDHIKLNSHITVANMSQLPVADKEFSYLIYCLSIGWGNQQEISTYLREGFRVALNNCIIKIICTNREFENIKEVIEHDFINEIRLHNNIQISEKFKEINCVVTKPDLFGF